MCAAADRRGAIALCGYSCLKHKGLGARLVTRRDPRRGAARPARRGPPAGPRALDAWCERRTTVHLWYSCASFGLDRKK